MRKIGLPIAGGIGSVCLIFQSLGVLAQTPESTVINFNQSATANPVVEVDTEAAQTNIEAFYNFPVSNNVTLTPLVQVITHPGNQSANGTITTGTLRTVFSF